MDATFDKNRMDLLGYISIIGIYLLNKDWNDKECDATKDPSGKHCRDSKKNYEPVSFFTWQHLLRRTLQLLKR